jgi:type I restriction enzyme, S subunit
LSKTVGDFVTLQRGKTYPGALVGTPGPALLGLGSIEPGGGFRQGHYKTFGGDCPEQLMCKPGDIYVALKGATKDGSMVGSVARVPATVAAGRLTQDTARLDFKNDSAEVRRVLYWLLRTPQYRDYCDGRYTGSAAASFSREDFLAFPIPDTSPGVAVLAQLFDRLEDKIELNRQTNETLEALARAIFKDWFVDFGPSRAKAEGRAPYLAPALWDLFPDRLDGEGKPEGWERSALGAVAESPRRGISPEDFAPDTPYIGLEHMPRRSIALADWEGAGKVASNKSIFKKGEFLFGKLRPYFHKVGIAAVDGICSTDIVIVIPKTTAFRSFVLLCLSSDEFVDYASRTSTGTKMPRTKWQTMAQYAIPLPPRSIVAAFQDLTAPLMEQVLANIHESKTLAETRDLLLPKLMSGEIRLREADRMVEDAA